MPPLLKLPIVFAHGLMGFGELRFGRARIRYFKEIADSLEAAGNRVLMSGVPPTGSVARRAEKLKSNIAASFGESPVHIIAHSMGGLDARHMISHLGMAGRVATLTTLGTPHRGSSFADWICERGRSTRFLEFLADFGADVEALDDLTRANCSRFNDQTPDAEGVRYFSVAGEKPRARTMYVMRPSHGIISRAEGPNDGLVAVESARWGESFDVWDCDHVNLVGWTGPIERMRGFFTDPSAGYARILDRIRAVEA